MQSAILYEPNPQTEMTFFLRRKKQGVKEQKCKARMNLTSMVGGGGDQRMLRDFVTPGVQGIASSIAHPTVDTNNFELKPAHISMVQQSQFGGTPLEDPNPHLSIFLEVCDTLKLNGASNDAIGLRLFPFSLRDKARAWLDSLLSGYITTWDELIRTFLTKFFPPSKTASLRNQITNFT